MRSPRHVLSFLTLLAVGLALGGCGEGTAATANADSDSPSAVSGTDTSLLADPTAGATEAAGSACDTACKESGSCSETCKEGGSSCCDKQKEGGATAPACLCAKGKAGEPVWCESCKKGYVEGKEVCCSSCVKSAQEELRSKLKDGSQ